VIKQRSVRHLRPYSNLSRLREHHKVNEDSRPVDRIFERQSIHCDVSYSQIQETTDAMKGGFSCFT
jgi:hypothetical protein